MVDASAEIVLAKYMSQHVQHRCAFGVMPGRARRAMTNRQTVGFSCRHGTVHLIPEIPIEFVVTIHAAHKQTGVEGGETLLQPLLAVVPAGDEIPKPLVGGFVGVHNHIIAVLEAPFVYPKEITKCGCGCVFHGAIQKVLHHHLGVADPRVGDARFGGQEINDLLAVSGSGFNFIGVFRVVPKLYRGSQSGSAVFHGVIANAQHQ